MPEEVLFVTETRETRASVAEYLRTVADRLEGDGDLTLTAGEESVTLSPPEEVTFEVKAEREGPADGPYERSVELELEWDEGDTGSGGGLEIG